MAEKKNDETTNESPKQRQREREALLEAVETKARIHRLRNGVKSSAIQAALNELDAQITEELQPQVAELSRAWSKRETERRRENKGSSTHIPVS